jgi:hypothetical protein
MNKKNSRVYKGLVKKRPDKETIKAARIVWERISDVVRGENDFTCEPLKPLNRFFRRYTNTYEYPQDGWQVRKILIPDKATKYGEGYHKIAIVACTAETEAGVKEAMMRAGEVKTKLEKIQAHITTETVIILSKNIPFMDANRLRGALTSEYRKVFIYSVKNAIGVAKNALNKFANLFTIRAKAILKLPKLKEEMRDLAYIFLKRGEELSKQVSQLEKVLGIMSKGKKEIQKARNAAWRFIQKAREWGISVWFDKEELYDFGHVKDKINLAADLQGIDIYRLQQLDDKSEAEERFKGG